MGAAIDNEIILFYSLIIVFPQKDVIPNMEKAIVLSLEILGGDVKFG